MKMSRRVESDYRCRDASAILQLVILFLMFLGHMNSAHATGACESEVGRLISVQGIIELRRANEQTWRKTALHSVVCLGDSVRARSHSRAALLLNNASVVRLDQKTSMTFPKPENNSATLLLELFAGAIHIITRTPKPFKVRTPFLTGGVEGTEFLVGVDEYSTQLILYEGKVTATNDLGTIVLANHEAAIASRNNVPKKINLINPTDAVQWALYYPAIINVQLEQLTTSLSALPELKQSIEFYWQGKVFEALSRLDNIELPYYPDNLMLYRASLLLTVGQAQEAKTMIEEVLVKQSGNSDAYALLALIAVVQNAKEHALELATHANALNARSASAKLALSYAQQAYFEIEQALASVQKAVTIEPENTLVWTRLAELHMSVGDLDHALEAAQQAVNLNPDIARTQTVLGYAHLLQFRTQLAQTVFSHAILLDQTDPLPRLGLGLALIREGKLEAGRVELEIAASLDPANSLIRSYLGKAYFEEKRYPLASTQFDLAKERDPEDPTPWLYDAIQKQTQNRPVEALKDIQKSIELNDNRAVYRSRLLLDRDEAARGSSLARIFENLGFEKRALMETAKSLSFDPGNHSAHRFLSDAYVNVPRHEIARVSELLQAQLLQPINVNPVQPHLAVADLNIITGTAPSAIGFNEFSPLMERNKPQLVASGIVGNNSTLGNEVVASLQRDRASISLGQFHHETNGFRPNNDQRHNIYNVFFQYALTPRLNIQTEARTRTSEHGDIQLNFSKFGEDGLNGRSYYRRELNEQVARFGARYSISPSQELLFSTKYINREERLAFSKIEDPLRLDLSGLQIEAQHLFREKFFNSTMGGGTYDFGGIYDRNTFYAYTNAHLPGKITTTLGLSYDAFSSTVNTRIDKISPKIGLQWDMTDYFRWRVAWFETTKSHIIAQQSLEPTQVAGFNQFFDEPNGTRVRRMGIGFDARVSDKLFSGFEASEREVKVPSAPASEEILSKQNEQLYRAYLYGLPHTLWAMRGEFQYENLAQNGANTITNPDQIKTISMPLSIEHFHPSGLFTRFTATFVKQDLFLHGDYGRTRDPQKTASGIDSFFLLDYVIGYRLPNRRGIMSLEGKNLLDEEFFYRNSYLNLSEPVNPIFLPTRTIYLKLTMNF